MLDRESDFRPAAKNPTSSAFGMGQLITSNRIKYAAIARKSNPLLINPDTTVPIQQFQMFRAYVRGHHQTTDQALAHHNAKNWY